MKNFIVAVGEYLYDSVWVSKKSTIVGIVLAAGIEFLTFTTSYLQNIPQGWAHALAGITAVIGALLRSQVAIEARKAKRALKVGAAAVVAFLLSFATPAYAGVAKGPLSLQVADAWSLHLNVQVPALAYSLTEGQFKGQLTFGLNYALDYKDLVAIGVGGGYVQTNDSPGMLFTAMLGGPVLGSFGTQTVFRPAALYEYRWTGGVHENLLAFTFALQF